MFQTTNQIKCLQFNQNPRICGLSVLEGIVFETSPVLGTKAPQSQATKSPRLLFEHTPLVPNGSGWPHQHFLARPHLPGSPTSPHSQPNSKTHHKQIKRKAWPAFGSSSYVRQTWPKLTAVYLFAQFCT